MSWFFLKHIFSTHSLLKWSTILLAPSLIYNSCQLLFSIINSSLFPTQHTDVNAFLHQTIIKFPWWSTMSRNSTIMLTHYAWPPNPLFDAIKFISTGSRSLLFFCFLFFFSKNYRSRNLFPSIVEVFFPEKYVLEYHHYVLVWIPLLTSENLWLKSRACH